MFNKLIDKFRPQAFTAVVILGVIASYAMYMQQSEIAAGATGGIVALVKDILQTEK